MNAKIPSFIFLGVTSDASPEKEPQPPEYRIIEPANSDDSDEEVHNEDEGHIYVNDGVDEDEDHSYDGVDEDEDHSYDDVDEDEGPSYVNDGVDEDDGDDSNDDEDSYADVRDDNDYDDTVSVRG